MTPENREIEAQRLIRSSWTFSSGWVSSVSDDTKKTLSEILEWQNVWHTFL